MLKADGNGVFGPQAKLGAGGVLRHEHPPPDILARKVDEHVRGLQNGRLDAPVSLALEKRDQRNNGIGLRHVRRPNPSSGLLNLFVLSHFLHANR